MRNELAYKAADAIAEYVLQGKTDKHGSPLIEHSRRVAAACSHLRPYQQFAALLHDCIEDGSERLDLPSIQVLFGWPVRKLLFALSRMDGESYADYIHRLAENHEAAEIKLADLADNLDETRGPIPESLRQRYLDARKMLQASCGTLCSRERPPEYYEARDRKE